MLYSVVGLTRTCLASDLQSSTSFRRCSNEVSKWPAFRGQSSPTKFPCLEPKRSSAFEGARPRRLPHDAAVTVAHGVRSTGTETRDRLPFAPQRGSGPTYPRACAVSAEPFCHFCLPNRRCNTRNICSSKYSLTSVTPSHD